MLGDCGALLGCEVGLVEPGQKCSCGFGGAGILCRALVGGCRQGQAWGWVVDGAAQPHQGGPAGRITIVWVYF